MRSSRGTGNGASVVRVPKAAELVADDIRRQILRGTLPEGHALPPEAELISLYEVSRPTLREALRILESQALIQIRRGANGGARITLPTAQVAAMSSGLVLQSRGTTLSDVFRARSVIEPAAVRMIAESGSGDAIATLEAAHCRECELRDDWGSFNVEAADFHRLVVQVAGNETLGLLNEMLVTIIVHHHGAMFRRSQAEFEGLVVSTIDYHGKLLEHLRAGDGAAAEAVWRQHLDDAAQAALQWLGDRTVIELFEEDL